MTPNYFATIKYSNAGVPLWANRFAWPVGDNDIASAIAVAAAAGGETESQMANGKWPNPIPHLEGERLAAIRVVMAEGNAT